MKFTVDNCQWHHAPRLLSISAQNPFTWDQVTVTSRLHTISDYHDFFTTVPGTNDGVGHNLEWQLQTALVSKSFSDAFTSDLATWPEQLTANKVKARWCLRKSKLLSVMSEWSTLLQSSANQSRTVHHLHKSSIILWWLPSKIYST